MLPVDCSNHRNRIKSSKLQKVVQSNIHSYRNVFVQNPFHQDRQLGLPERSFLPPRFLSLDGDLEPLSDFDLKQNEK